MLFHRSIKSVSVYIICYTMKKDTKIEAIITIFCRVLPPKRCINLQDVIVLVKGVFNLCRIIAFILLILEDKAHNL
jgi:hypothetical protein